jgi:hypothetical protein
MCGWIFVSNFVTGSTLRTILRVLRTNMRPTRPMKHTFSPQHATYTLRSLPFPLSHLSCPGSSLRFTNPFSAYPLHLERSFVSSSRDPDDRQVRTNKNDRLIRIYIYNIHLQPSSALLLTSNYWVLSSRLFSPRLHSFLFFKDGLLINSLPYIQISYPHLT